MYDVNAFPTRSNGTYNTFTWGNGGNCQTINAYGGAIGDCDGVPSNVVRYDTPSLFGFGASTSWGEDDVWAVSGRYAGEWVGFKLAATAAYNRSTDETGTAGTLGLTSGGTQGRANGGLDTGFFQTGAYLEHVASGLWAYGAYGIEDHSTTDSVRGAEKLNPEADFFYVKAGFKRKHFSIGSTTLYGEYGRKNDAFTAQMFDAGVIGSDMDHYGAGIVQNIDAAAMQMWLAWRRHYEGDVSCNSNQNGATGCDTLNLNDGSNSLDEFDLIKFGALIAF